MFSLDLNEALFFLVHMMDQISVDTPCDVPEKIFFSKLRLIISEVGANSADLNALGCYF